MTLGNRIFLATLIGGSVGALAVIFEFWVLLAAVPGGIALYYLADGEPPF